MTAPELKQKYPNAYYCDLTHQIYRDNDLGSEVVEEDAISLINKHFEGREIFEGHGSGISPEDFPVTTSGRNYVKIVYNGNYAEAFSDIL